MAAVFCVVITDEGRNLSVLALAFRDDVPVTHLHLGGITGTSLLLLHLHIETSLVNGKAVLATDKFSKIEGESIGIEKRKGLLACNLSLTGCLGFLHYAVKQFYTCLQGAQEAVLLFLHYLGNQLALSFQLGVGSSHLSNENGKQTVHKGFFLPQECIGITNGTTQDSADNITGLCIAWQLSVCNTEGYGTQVVGNYTHGDIGLFLIAIFVAAEVSDSFNDGLEDISIVVGVLALNSTYKTLESHTGINNIHAQGFKMAVGLTLVLHEYDIPYLNNLWVVLVYQLATGNFSLFFRSTAVQVNLGTGTAWTRIAHFPEVVVLVSVDDMISGNMLQPVPCSLVVANKVFLGRALKDSYIKILWIKFEHINKVFPSHIDGTFLEVVTKRPVAQHLEHGVVIGIVTYFLQVVVLTANTQTLLTVGTTAWLGVTGTQNNVLPLVHSSISKHQRRVVLYNHWSRRNYLMPF